MTPQERDILQDVTAWAKTYEQRYIADGQVPPPWLVKAVKSAETLLITHEPQDYDYSEALNHYLKTTPSSRCQYNGALSCIAAGEFATLERAEQWARKALQETI